jgi:hypothetical protein
LRDSLSAWREVVKHGAVVGISLTFMAVDLLGSIFWILSLTFKKKVEVLAAIAYSFIVVCPSPSTAQIYVFFAD